jgi:hypothetical protein
VIGAGATENDDYDSWYSFSSSSGSNSSEASIDPISNSISVSSEEDSSPKNSYNASASSTSTPQNGRFSDGWVNGSLVNDITNIGGLNLNITFGDLETYDQWFAYLPIDGVLGLSPYASQNGIPNVLTQIAGQLAQPLVVLKTHRDLQDEITGQDDPSEVNEITLGTADVNGCNGNWSWHASDVGDENSGGWGTVGNITSLGVADGCHSVVNASRPIYILNWFLPIFGSYQVEQVFVQASGAQFNTSSGYFQLSCDQVTQAKNVALNSKDGSSISLTPTDYTIKYDGECYLFAMGWYDEYDSDYAGYGLTLGQQFANNHCVAYNIAENLVGISNSGQQQAASTDSGNVSTQV